MFDPNLPQAGTEIDAVEMRSQLNGLNDLIEAVPVLDSASVLTTTTLPPGSAATAEVNVNGDTLEFSFGIPEGAPGLPGEVTTAQMDGAIALAITATARNPTSVSPMSMSFSDPPTQGELMQVQDKYNELLAALYRAP